MRFLFLGDVVGRSGRKAVIDTLPKLIARYKLDFVVVNGENAAGGFGITEAITNELLAAGADCVTLGNHAFDQKEALVFIARQPQLIRPINFPKGTPGAGAGLFKAKNGAEVLVINAMGRVFMTELDCPFRAVDAATTACKLREGADVIFVDFHAEATSEKEALGYFLDGRVTGVVGTHTHVPTADHRVLPNGTAYMSDGGNVWGLSVGVGDGYRGAGQPLPHAHSTRTLRAIGRSGDAVGHVHRCGRSDGAGAGRGAIAARRCFITSRAAFLDLTLGNERSDIWHCEKAGRAASLHAGAHPAPHHFQ